MKTRMILSLGAAALFVVGGSLSHADAIETLDAVDAMNRMEIFATGPANPKDTTCNLTAARSACTNGTDSLTFKGCTLQNGKSVVTGGWDEAFAGTGAATCTDPLVDGETVVKTSKGLTVTFDKGSMLLDSNGGKAYDGTIIPATGLTVSKTRSETSITITGAHAITKNLSGIVTKEVYMITPTAMLMSGAQKDGSKLISTGVVRTLDQLKKSTTTTTFNKVAWKLATCCHPTAGSITETMTGSLSGTTSLTFNPTCGSATRVDKNGKSSNITLHACK